MGYLQDRLSQVQSSTYRVSIFLKTIQKSDTQTAKYEFEALRTVHVADLWQRCQFFNSAGIPLNVANAEKVQTLLNSFPSAISGKTLMLDDFKKADEKKAAEQAGRYIPEVELRSY